MDPAERLREFKRNAKAMGPKERAAALASEEFARLIEAATCSARFAVLCEGHCCNHCGAHCGNHCRSHPDRSRPRGATGEAAK